MSTAVIQKIKTANLKRALQLQSQTLYNASDEPVNFTCGGNPSGAFPFCIPPDGPHNGTVADGTLKVYDIYGVDPEAMRNAKKNKLSTEDLPKRLVLSAITIVEHAIRKLEKRGVTVLTGDPADDALLKAEARENWIKFREVTAENEINHYRERTSAFSRDPRNAGMAPPPMKDYEIKAQIWLDQHRLGLTNQNKLVCKFRDGFSTDDAAIMDVHMRASHPFAEDVRQTERALANARGSETPEPEPDEDEVPEVVAVAPKRRGRPPKVQPAA